MNLRKMKTALAGLVMVGLVFTGCKGEDGDDGNDGNANVVSNTYLILPGDWDAVFNSSGQQTGAQAVIGVPSLTASAVEQAAVHAYFSTDTVAATREWIAIPSGSFTFRYKTDTATVGLNGFTGVGVNSYCKVVVIPVGAALEGVDPTNYEEVKMVYGLKEDSDQ